jgi:hypothetical protein
MSIILVGEETQQPIDGVPPHGLGKEFFAGVVGNS